MSVQNSSPDISHRNFREGSYWPMIYVPTPEPIHVTRAFVADQSYLFQTIQIENWGGIILQTSAVRQKKICASGRIRNRILNCMEPRTMVAFSFIQRANWSEQLCLPRKIISCPGTLARDLIIEKMWVLMTSSKSRKVLFSKSELASH